MLNLGSPYTGVNGGESSRDLILGSGLVSGVSSGFEVMRVTQVSKLGEWELVRRHLQLNYILHQHYDLKMCPQGPAMHCT